MKRSRRRFLTLVAAASAAIATRPAASLAANTRAPKSPPQKKPGATAAPAALPADPTLRAGIAQQQRDLAKALKTLRDYPLEPGSDPAFVFTPVRAARPRRTP